MKLSNQAMGAIMMALQKSLLEQSDIVPVIGNFTFQLNENEELIVNNPPNFKVEPQNNQSSSFDPLLEEVNNTTGSD